MHAVGPFGQTCRSYIWRAIWYEHKLDNWNLRNALYFSRSSLFSHPFKKSNIFLHVEIISHICKHITTCINIFAHVQIFSSILTFSTCLIFSQIFKHSLTGIKISLLVKMNSHMWKHITTYINIYQLVSAGLEPVLSHTEKLCKVVYYVFKNYNHKIETCFGAAKTDFNFITVHFYNRGKVFIMQ